MPPNMHPSCVYLTATAVQHGFTLIFHSQSKKKEAVTTTACHIFFSFRWLKMWKSLVFKQLFSELEPLWHFLNVAFVWLSFFFPHIFQIFPSFKLFKKKKFWTKTTSKRKQLRQVVVSHSAASLTDVSPNKPPGCVWKGVYNGVTWFIILWVILSALSTPSTLSHNVQLKSFSQWAS